jgi:hypothetical protein
MSTARRCKTPDTADGTVLRPRSARRLAVSTNLEQSVERSLSERERWALPCEGERFELGFDIDVLALSNDGSVAAVGGGRGGRVATLDFGNNYCCSTPLVSVSDEGEGLLGGISALVFAPEEESSLTTLLWPDMFTAGREGEVCAEVAANCPPLTPSPRKPQLVRWTRNCTRLKSIQGARQKLCDRWSGGVHQRACRQWAVCLQRGPRRAAHRLARWHWAHV